MSNPQTLYTELGFHWTVMIFTTGFVVHADVSALAPLKFGYIFVFICYFYTFIIQSFMYNIKTLINISKRGAGI